MSYVRFGDGSDVYVYHSTFNKYVCCGCQLSGADMGSFETGFETETKQEMLDHLNKHTEAGHRVPGYALERLKSEIEHGA